MSSPILIIGGGLAGLFCALKLSPRPVVVVTGAPLGEGASSAWAQGGIAAAIGEGDTPEQHLADTIAAGAGLVDVAVARAMVEEASARIEDLLRYGVPFDRDLEGHFVLSREAAHTRRRVVRVAGDKAGAAIIAALLQAVLATPSITVRHDLDLERLMTDAQGICGAVVRGRRGFGSPLVIPARRVVLATGGIGHLYAVTTNPPEAAGIGLAAAARIGADVIDAEFVQFHPTALALDRDPAPLATEALRGEGAILVNRDGHRFMLDLHKDGELAPRDIVARGVFAEIRAGRGAWLDARAAVGTAFPERFPTVFEACQNAGIDPRREPMPVAPAEHYHMGGLAVDERGRTSVPGLFAAGEVASTGAHGANRLASNSLLEAVVFAARIAETINGKPIAAAPERAVPDDVPQRVAPRTDLLARLRSFMTAHVGVIREASGLDKAIRAASAIRADAASDPHLANMASAALLVAVAARKRQESRGGHMRADFPLTDPAQATRRRLTLADAEAAALDTEPA
jgi:L-aspartate oxidase